MNLFWKKNEKFQQEPLDPTYEYIFHFLVDIVKFLLSTPDNSNEHDCKNTVDRAAAARYPG